MKESLRTKAQLSDRDIDMCYQSFMQELSQRQSMSALSRLNIWSNSVVLSLCSAVLEVIEVWYDTIWKKSLTWTQKLNDQLDPVHVARKTKWKKKKLKQTNASAHLVQYRFKIRELY